VPQRKGSVKRCGGISPNAAALSGPALDPLPGEDADMNATVGSSIGSTVV
jgi:hypothetical protein